MAIIQIKNVSKVFAKRAAVDALSAEIPEGKIVGLIGPDGAGKTTLIRLMAGLLRPTEGTITLAGLDTVSEQSSLHEILGYMPQKFGLYEDLTVMQNLKLYADLKNVVGEQRKQIFHRLLQFTSLGPFTTRLAGALSGGMKQKLGLACALMQKPQVLLLDEPSAGVDPISRRQLWSMVHQLVEQGVSVIWSTAYLDEAERCDSVLLLNEGKLLYEGVPQALSERVAKRVFVTAKPLRKKRQVLTDALKLPEVVDATIQGARVRLVFQHEHPKVVGLQLTAASPRFEDAFIDILGGGTRADSEVAALCAELHEKDHLAVEANDLTKRFGSFTAAEKVSFKIERGEIFGLLGPNGAGKTTTFKMLCGLLTPTEGTSYVNGVNLQQAAGKARSHIGYMAQKFSLYGTLSTYQNLRFFSGAYNLKGAKRRQRIHQMMKIFSLEPYSDTSAEILPLGFKQRLALACALIHAPDVLFLDEPTSGVDPLTRREFWHHINGLVSKGVTVVVTTHFMDEAEYCDRIGLIYRSRLITIGTPDELKVAAQSEKNPEPTLEDAFIALVQNYDGERGDE